MISDPKVLIFAFLGGIIPALVWLWFWLKEDRKKKEPVGLLAIIFILGMLSVIIVLPIQQFLQNTLSDPNILLVVFATVEELAKLFVVILLVRRTHQADQPIDWAIYFITGALGFAALENMLFLAQPLSLGNSTVGLLTGHLRFLGSTLLHAVASGMIGIGIGLSFYKNRLTRKIYFLGGLVAAITLHSIFNFFIIRNDGGDFLKVFAFLWVITIIVMLLFERLRKISR